jgi:hypothetical protein
MRPLLSLGVSVAVFTFVSVQPLNMALSQSDGFTVLFDGKNLDHWQGDGKAQFAIQDGAVIATGKKDPKETAFLISKDKYKDFQLRAEFWVSDDANSGIFIRCEDPPNRAQRPAMSAIFSTPAPIQAMAQVQSSTTPK